MACQPYAISVLRELPNQAKSSSDAHEGRIAIDLTWICDLSLAP